MNYWTCSPSFQLLSLLRSLLELSFADRFPVQSCLGVINQALSFWRRGRLLGPPSGIRQLLRSLPFASGAGCRVLDDSGASSSWVEEVKSGCSCNIEGDCTVSGGFVLCSTMLDTGFCPIPSECGIKSTGMGGAWLLPVLCIGWFDGTISDGGIGWGDFSCGSFSMQVSSGDCPGDVEIGDCSKAQLFFLQTGSIGFRNFLFLSDNLRLPSILILYCRCGKVSTITPVLSHLFGLVPVWFWTWTACPINSGESSSH